MSGWLKRRAQSRLRKALLAGPHGLAEVLECVAAPQPQHASARRSWRPFQTLTSVFTAAAPAADLDYAYDDDLGATAVAYLATGSRLLDAKPVMHGRARPSVISMMSSAWLGSTVTQAAASQEARAALLTALFDTGQRPNLSVLTNRADSLLHCCLLNGGCLPVLAVLLGGLPFDYPLHKRPRLQHEDALGRTALELALALGNWEAVGLLLRAGALVGSRRMTTAVEQVHSALPVAAPRSAANAGSSVFSSAAAAALPLSVSTLGSKVVGLLPTRFRGLWGALGPQQEPELLQQHMPAASERQGSCGAMDPGSGCVQVLETLEFARLLQDAVRQVQAAVGVDESTAATLLTASGYDVQAATQAGRSWAAGPSDAQCLQATVAASGPGARMVDRTVTAQQSASGRFAAPQHAALCCMVCYEQQAPESLAMRLPCKHPDVTCNSCWRNFIAERLEEGQPHRISCPWPDCGLMLSLGQMQRLLRPAEFNKVQIALAKHYVTANAFTTWCPRPGCEAIISLRPDSQPAASVQAEPRAGDPSHVFAAVRAGRGVGVTCSCGTRFCFACKVMPPHEPASCEQHREWQQLQSELKRDLHECSEGWLRQHTKPCPKCGVRIQKAGGCLHMTCRSCQHHFCWLCSQPFPGGHDDAFSCMAAATDPLPATGAPDAMDRAGTIYDALSGLWGRMTQVAQKRRQEHFMRRYLAFGGGVERAAGQVARMRLLLSAATLGPDLQQQRQQQQRAGRPGSWQAGSQLLLPIVSGGFPAHCLALPSDGWWQGWLAALLYGREVLSNSFILAYHTSDPTQLRSLGQLQGQLALALEALAAPLEALPNAPAAVEAPMRQGAPLMAGTMAASMARGFLVAVGAGLLHAGAALPYACQRHAASGHAPQASSTGNAGSAASNEDSRQCQELLNALARVNSSEAAEQLLYTLALLHERRGMLDQLVQEANSCSLSIIRAARAGLCEVRSSSVALNPLDVVLSNVLGAG